MNKKEKKEPKKQDNSLRSRNKLISLRFSEEEKNDYIKLCKRLGMNMTETLIYIIKEQNKLFKGDDNYQNV